jgi:hypothetical protein
VWKAIIIAGGLVAAWALTTTPFVHDAVRAKAIGAVILILPFALLALWVERRRKAKAKAAKPAPRPGYQYPFGGRR